MKTQKVQTTAAMLGLFGVHHRDKLCNLNKVNKSDISTTATIDFSAINKS